jgi:hypothetical protein
MIIPGRGGGGGVTGESLMGKAGPPYVGSKGEGSCVVSHHPLVAGGGRLPPLIGGQPQLVGLLYDFMAVVSC